MKNKDFFSKNNTLRIVAVIAAVLLWLYVVQVQNPVKEQAFKTVVELRNVPEGLCVSNDVGTISIRLQGNSQVLSDLSLKDIVAYVDMSSATVGQYVGNIQTDLPSGVSVVSLSQNSVSLVVEVLKTQQRNVEVVYTDAKLPNGYKAMDTVVTPTIITLAGSVSRLAEVTKVCVEVDLSDRTTNYVENQPVLVCDAKGNDLSQWVTVSPASINVFVPIVGDIPEKIVPIGAHIIGNVGDGYTISRVVVLPSVVTAFAQMSILNSVSYIYTEPIDVTGLVDGFETTVRLVVPDNVTIFDDEVEVWVEIEKVVSRNFANVLVTFENVPKELSLNKQADIFVDVSVSGSQSVINALTFSDVKIYADLTDAKAGTNVVNLKASLPQGISDISIEPDVVRVVLD